MDILVRRLIDLTIGPDPQLQRAARLEAVDPPPSRKRWTYPKGKTTLRFTR